MWSRAELKGRAKTCLSKYYWAALAVTFLVGLLGGGNGFSSAGTSGWNMNRSGKLSNSYSNIGGGSVSGDNWMVLAGIAGIVLIVVLIAVIVGMIFRVFVGNVINVGGCRFFMESRAAGRSAGVGRIFYGFGGGQYLNVVKTQFFKDLFIFLWTLLLIIPGIIKSYEYYMVPYILSENPGMAL